MEDLTGKLVRIMQSSRRRHITPGESGKIGIVVSLKYAATGIRFYRVMTDTGFYTYHATHLEVVI